MDSVTTQGRALELRWPAWPQRLAPTPATLSDRALKLIDSSLGSSVSVPDGVPPKLVFITGGIASGKTTLYQHLLKQGKLELEHSFALHDPDLIMEQLPGYTQARRNGEVSAWGRFEREAYEISMTALRVAVGGNCNVVAMRTLANETLLELIEDMVVHRSYQLELHILDVPLGLSLQYAARRADRDGRFISSEIIKERYNKTMERLPRLKALAKEVSHWDLTCFSSCSTEVEAPRSSK